MMRLPTFLFLLSAITSGVLPAATDVSIEAPWGKPRTLAAFRSLLDRSPFSLPTAEESSPLAERFSLTGAADLNGDPLVFVLDRTSQNRQMLSKKPNAQNMSLLEYLPNPDPRKMKATIQVDGQVATISYNEPAAQTQQPAQPGKMGQPPKQTGQVNRPQQPDGVASPRPTTVVNVPGSPAFQQQDGATPTHLIIRRPKISGQPTP